MAFKCSAGTLTLGFLASLLPALWDTQGLSKLPRLISNLSHGPWTCSLASVFKCDLGYRHLRHTQLYVSPFLFMCLCCTHICGVTLSHTSKCGGHRLASMSFSVTLTSLFETESPTEHRPVSPSDCPALALGFQMVSPHWTFIWLLKILTQVLLHTLYLSRLPCLCFVLIGQLFPQYISAMSIGKSQVLFLPGVKSLSVDPVA